MTDPIRIVVDGPPVPYSERTTLWRGKVGSQRRPKVVAYQTAISWAARQVMAGRPPLEGPIWFSATFFMPMPKRMRKMERIIAEQELLPHAKRPDRTNLLKAAEDALNGIVWVDDGQVSGGMPLKFYSRRPRVELTVEPWANNH